MAHPSNHPGGLGCRALCKNLSLERKFSRNAIPPTLELFRKPGFDVCLQHHREHAGPQSSTLCHLERTRELAHIANDFSAAQLQPRRARGGWSAHKLKDVLTHLCFWEQLHSGAHKLGGAGWGA
eukprot:1151275-Pelagomonas_calceolata.AAC.8